MTGEETAAFDPELETQLEQLSYWSHGDYVEVRIASVEQTGDDSITVEFAPPVGGTFEQEMDIPPDPAYETEFTRLLRTCGHNYDTAPKIVGERVPANYTDDGWEIDYDPPQRTLGQRLYGTVVPTAFSAERWLYGVSIGALIVAYPIVSILAFAAVHQRYPDVDLARWVMLWLWVGGTSIWLLAVHYMIAPLPRLAAFAG